MFSLESCASGYFELCSSMSCARRRAQASPAGPPPTMTTSASICGRSILGRGLRKINIQFRVSSFEKFVRWRQIRSGILKTRNLKLSFRLLHFFDQRRHDVEQIADHAYVGDFKNRGFRILIDREDRTR